MKEKKKRGRPYASKQIDKIHLLETAVKEFANFGFEGTLQKNIARKARIANSLMNYHFDDKEDLWKQSVQELANKLNQRFSEIENYFKDLQGIPAFKAYTRQFIYFSAEHPEFYKIIFHEMCTKTERANWLVAYILTPIHQLFEQKEGNAAQSKKGPLDLPFANFESLIIGAANIFFIHSFQMEKMYGINPFEKKEIERHADLMIELIFAKFDKE